MFLHPSAALLFLFGLKCILTSNTSLSGCLFQVFSRPVSSSVINFKDFHFFILQLLCFTYYLSFVKPVCGVLSRVLFAFVWQMFQKDPYSMENVGRITNSMKAMNYNPPQLHQPDQQPYRDYDHPPSRYDISSGGGGYPEYRSNDHIPLYENSVPQYDQQQRNHYGQPPSTANSQGYDLRMRYGDGPDAQYTPPLRYDEPPPQQGFDGRPRYGKPTGPGPVHYDELPPPPQGYDLSYDRDSHLVYPLASRSPELAPQRPTYNQGPSLQLKGYRPQHFDPTPANSVASLTPPPKAEAHSPSPMEAAKPAPSRDEPQEEDPAMRPQSVLTRVKMFENKRSVSPQKPQSKPADDIVRSNHYDPEEDEDYYRKQLYNRFVPKPFTTSAKPFTRMFESPKFNHNLLSNDKPEIAPKGPTSSPVKPQIPPQPQNADHDSGVDTFTRTVDNRSKHQQNNVNAVPKAIPVSALEDDEDEDEGHTVVATARGIFNSNGGVLSSIETGVSIIIPQGAIPDGVEQEIYFKVCRDNSILPPLDKEKGNSSKKWRRLGHFSSLS
ncbi:hypothetical protein XENOCAPTIV_000016 [Xenoophorus captivus]|uniref:ZU5 domain-containing protein n=1 Tax=Xenoophorus captivus TaxID=1517983 RepID=A0ABV0SAR7_9TELE